MPNDESLADRLNRLAQQKKLEHEAEKQVQRTQEQIGQYIVANAKPEFDRFLQALEAKISEINPALKDLPSFEFMKGGISPHVKQGNSAAYLSFMQPVMNAPPILLRLSFARAPGMYLDIFSGPPEPERYQLQPAMEVEPDRIVWSGDLGDLSSDELVDFVLNQLTQYFLDHRPSG